MVGLCLQEMVDWFNAIRAARFHYLQVAFPGASDEEVRKDRGWQGNCDGLLQHSSLYLVYH